MATEAAALWKTAQAVCFDVDSTVCVDEGIDELAGFLGKKDAVAEWTSKAMGGGVTFQDALAARLQLMQPSQQQLNDFLEQSPPKLSPGIANLVNALHEKGVHVYLISGGFTQMIHPVADLLGIAKANVFANTILFNADGAYAGFDEEAFTSRSGGKPACVKHLRNKHAYTRVAMVGDGATDLEAKVPGEAADVFIGFGGVQERQKVVENADWFVKSFDPLIEATKARQC
ncbi:Phosphoserine phosphatase [Diplonema papillatum]|nr:Phosphoserine phosphatase [Diplonema papillatum]